MLDFSKKFTSDVKQEFSSLLRGLSEEIGFKVSSRGWCYIMEQKGYINKDQFDKVSTAINDCRKEGYLPVDFVAEEASRAFSGIETPDTGPIEHTLRWMLGDVLQGDKYYTPDWWDGEEYYIQMLVEKIDLVTLFKPVCEKYHIPIANAKGWSSISQRAEYARRFKEAEDKGLECVLLYCGDHDPDGLRISQTIYSNLEDVKDVYFSDGETGYNPENLIIDRFGLNYDLIKENNFTWIDNLVTGSGKDLSDSSHRNHYMPYVQNYLRTIGSKKCESNVIVTLPEVAKKLVTGAITKYLGDSALYRFAAKRKEVKDKYMEALDSHNLKDSIYIAIDNIK